jgi:hypothetical protein
MTPAVWRKKRKRTGKRIEEIIKYFFKIEVERVNIIFYYMAGTWIGRREEGASVDEEVEVEEGEDGAERVGRQQGHVHAQTSEQ